MNFPIPVRAVALDLDGTLLHTAPDLADAANRMLLALGRPTLPEALVMTYVGNGAARLVKRLLTGEMEAEPDAAAFEQAQDLFFEHYAEVLTRRSAPYPGAMEGVKQLHAVGYKLACITNKPERFTLPLLQAMDMLPYFSLVLSGDSLPRKKPDPLPLLHMAEMFGVSPAQMVMIGDSSADVDAARAAGCAAIAVSYGYNRGQPADMLGADAVIDSLQEAAFLLTCDPR
ncbi:phosphoglycolate phosphatase [Methylovorus menthalis]|uniref:phosphoglycolate phosphatase n=1 Tax=Methylovorus menthalis TaxID=1002227 RepID=UPI001E357B49|nr:phosphoglycolate phosphatase [Methylovorus menthalis]MCB4809774.1 phosphoglycolate phosphatase [Methylovorus menthalis]